MKFSIGYNNDRRLLKIIGKYKDNIEALYFPIPNSFLGSGRHLSQNRDYIKEVPWLIKKCKSLHIRSQLLINATCVGASGLEKKFFLKIIDYLKKMYQAGLDSVVVTNPLYISEIRKRLPGITIESSVNCYVKSVEEALYLKSLGVDVLTIDRDINRDIPLIQKIKDATGLKIRVMVNEGCLRNCPFRKMHYNHIAHLKLVSKIEIIDQFFWDRWCMKILFKNPEKIFSIPFIPPDALRYYAPFVDYFKITSRASPTSQTEIFLKAYIEQNFSGNLLELLDCPGLAGFNFVHYETLKKYNFFETMLQCKNNCNECDYCNRLFNEAVLIRSDLLQGHEKMNADEKAIMMYNGFLKTFGKNASVYGALAKAYLDLGFYQEAIIASYEALALNPNQVSVYDLLGCCYEKIGKPKKAIKIYTKAKKLFPRAAGIYKGLAQVYLDLARYREALNAARKALVLNPNQASAYMLLGCCYEKIGKPKSAMKIYKKAKKLFPYAFNGNQNSSQPRFNSATIHRASKPGKRIPIS